MFKRILVPLDGTEASDDAIRASIDFARQLGAAITGFLAEPQAQRLAGQRRGSPLLDEALEEDPDAPARGRQMLQSLEAGAHAAGVPFTARVQPAWQSERALIAAAEACGCELLLLASTERGVFDELLYGSQTKAVLAGCALPLLLLPPPGPI